MWEIRIATADDEGAFEDLADDVFDEAIDPALLREHLNDPRHHIAIARDEGRIVGFASGIHYVHPDKRPQFFVDEVGVAPSHHRRGIGKALVGRLLEHARSLGCTEAWVATEEDNAAARALYQSAGGREEPDRPVLYTFRLDEDRTGSPEEG